MNRKHFLGLLVALFSFKWRPGHQFITAELFGRDFIYCRKCLLSKSSFELTKERCFPENQSLNKEIIRRGMIGGDFYKFKRRTYPIDRPVGAEIVRYDYHRSLGLNHTSALATARYELRHLKS